MIDLARVLERLRPGEAFRLSSSVPPNTLLEWRGSGTPPTQEEIALCWADIIQEDATAPPERSMKERIEALETAVFGK